MLAILSITISIALLTLIVYGLHKHQAIEVKVSANRTLPLPPLNANLDSLLRLRRTRDKLEAQPRQASKSADSRASVAKSDSNDWQARVSAQKQAGDLTAALHTCKSAYPLWSAFNQACIVLRSGLDSATGSTELRNQQLSWLYHTAALAELLHDKSTDFRTLSSRQRKCIDLEAAASLKMPYSELGYAHLRLIRKCDIKLMHSLWGRPNKHQQPRVLHRQWWAKIEAQLP